jgi:hypothetical protein
MDNPEKIDKIDPFDVFIEFRQEEHLEQTLHFR